MSKSYSSGFDRELEEKQRSLTYHISKYEEACQLIQEGDYVRALERMTESAEPELPQDQYNWGVTYLNGQGVPVNLEKALKWFKLAEKQGYSDASAPIAIIYERMSDFSHAKDAYEQLVSAAKKDSKAMTLLSVWYYTGKYIEKNYKKALEYALSATKAFNCLECDRDICHCIAGLCYYYGEGTACNYYEAYKHFSAMRINGLDENPISKRILGLMYMQGLGTSQDIPKGVELLKESAEKHNDEVAMYWLGVLFLSGIHFETNKEIGLGWIKKSAEAEYEPAVRLLEKTDDATLLEQVAYPIRRPSDIPIQAKDAYFIDLAYPYVQPELLQSSVYETLDRDTALNAFWNYLDKNSDHILSLDIIDHSFHLVDQILQSPCYKTIISNDHKYIFDLGGYVTESLKMILSRMNKDSLIDEFSCISRTADSIFHNSDIYKLALTRLCQTVLSPYIFLVEALYDIRLLFFNNSNKAIQSVIIDSLLMLCKYFQRAIKQIVNERIPTPFADYSYLFPDFDDVLSKFSSTATSLLDQVKTIRYESIRRITPYDPSAHYEIIVFVNDKNNEFRSDQVESLIEISSALRDHKAFYIVVNERELTDKSYVSQLSSIIQNMRGVIVIDSPKLMGLLRKELISVPTLVVSTDRFDLNSSSLPYHSRHFCDKIVITDNNRSYALPMVWAATSLLVKDIESNESDIYRKRMLDDKLVIQRHDSPIIPQYFLKKGNDA